MSSSAVTHKPATFREASDKDFFQSLLGEGFFHVLIPTNTGPTFGSGGAATRLVEN